MKPVFQTIIDKGKGDCFSACLASILEIPLKKVPKFAKIHGTANFMHHARKWLAENYGLSILTIQMEDRENLETGDDIRIIGAFPNTPCIAGGISPNVGDCQHAVVGHLDDYGLNFVMDHDPNPSQKGIIGQPIHLYFLVPLKPEKLLRKPK